ncbi:helix-turn-helix transcriptional regulator [Kitasatospora albolonga]|uniref:helix-turn-helix domain-containing protein n=1 Tax=Kitasatospora albolonga TaxID=68173 RepID=UPI0031EF8E14
MGSPKPVDPASTPLAFVANEIRAYRDRAGLSQDQVGELLGYTADTIGLVERARRAPKKELLDRLDQVLNAHGGLSRLWPLVQQAFHEPYLLDYTEHEKRAEDIRSLEIQLVSGLLQTEAYAREVIWEAQVPNPEEKLALRLQRQERLRAADAPTCWFIVDEFVLRRQIGGPAVMREQLEFLIDAKAELDVEIQVLPREIGAHQGMGGVLTILAFSESPGVVYVENPTTGRYSRLPTSSGKPYVSTITCGPWR